MTDVTMEKIVSLCKRRGFIYPGSEIYGGLSGTWDYGPLGVELKNNIKNLWWKMFVQGRDDMYGVDAAILMNPKAWEASGHVSGFSDPLVECEKCSSKFRVDQLPGFSSKDFDSVKKEFSIKFNEWTEQVYKEGIEMLETAQQKHKKIDSLIKIIDTENLPSDVRGSLLSLATKMVDEAAVLVEKGGRQGDFIKRLDRMFNDSSSLTGVVTHEYLNRFVACPQCKNRKWAVPQQFNMMFQTQIGASEGNITYLRPETAGGIFVNFKNVVDSFHPKLPFGVGQIGKAFRNEIAPRDFIFRVRELEQMEVEYFVHPDSWEEAFEMWRRNVHTFNEAVGISKNAVHELEVADGDRAHYSKRTIDFEFDFPFGRKELYGLAYRTDFDLSAHSQASGTDLKIVVEEGKPPITPHVVEPSFGVDRTVLALLISSYTEDELGGEKRAYLKFNPAVAPVKAAVFPLLKNKPELVEKAREVYTMLKKQVPQIMWDDNGNIGKRYRRQDEIGTPFCITVDFDTLGEKPELKDTVTIRNRDTGKQSREKIADILSLIA